MPGFAFPAVGRPGLASPPSRMRFAAASIGTMLH